MGWFSNTSETHIVSVDADESFFLTVRSLMEQIPVSRVDLAYKLRFYLFRNKYEVQNFESTVNRVSRFFKDQLDEYHGHKKYFDYKCIIETDKYLQNVMIVAIFRSSWPEKYFASVAKITLAKINKDRFVIDWEGDNLFDLHE